MRLCVCRQGDAGNYAEIGKLIAEVISQVPDAQVMTDLDACAARLLAARVVRKRRRGIGIVCRNGVTSGGSGSARRQASARRRASAHRPTAVLASAITRPMVMKP